MRRWLSAALVIVVVFGVAAWWAGRGGVRAGGAALPVGHFRVGVRDVIRDGDCLVTEVDVETHPRATVRVTCDQPLRGGLSATAVGPPEPGGLTTTTLTLFGDHVRWQPGAVNARKLQMSCRSGAGTSLMSDTGPMPEGKGLADVLDVRIKPGVYRQGEPVELVGFQDRTYRLVVERPEPESAP